MYWLKGATDNEFSFVYTNPNPLTLITHWDWVFVLGVEIHNDLMFEFQPTKFIWEWEADEVKLNLNPDENISPNKGKWGLNNSFTIWKRLETRRLSKSKTKGKYGFGEDKEELLNGIKANKLPF